MSAHKIFISNNRYYLLFSFIYLAHCFNAFADPRPIRLGYLLDLSAKGAFMGVQSHAGAELARRELAARKMPIDIVYEDHRTDAKTGLSAARKILEVDDVDAVLCDLTPACVAASPSIAASKKIFIYQAPVDSILLSNPYSLKNFLNYQTGCKQIASFWKQQNLTHIAHFKLNTEFGELCLKGSREIFPTQEEFDYDPNNDLRSLITRIKNSNIQAIFQTGYEADYINRLRASADLNLFLPTGMPQPLLTSTIINSVPSSIIEGTIAFGFPKVSEDFINKLKKAELYKSEISIESAAIAYMQVHQLASAISSCGQDIDCQLKHLQEALPDSTLGFQGWKDRTAAYNFQLRKWTKDGWQAIPSSS